MVAGTEAVAGRGVEASGGDPLILSELSGDLRARARDARGGERRAATTMDSMLYPGLGCPRLSSSSHSRKSATVASRGAWGERDRVWAKVERALTLGLARMTIAVVRADTLMMAPDPSRTAKGPVSPGRAGEAACGSGPCASFAGAASAAYREQALLEVSEDKSSDISSA